MFGQVTHTLDTAAIRASSLFTSLTFCNITKRLFFDIEREYIQLFIDIERENIFDRTTESSALNNVFADLTKEECKWQGLNYGPSEWQASV